MPSLTKPPPFDVPPGWSAGGIKKDAPMLIGYRAYLNPNTGHGRAYEDLIPDRAL